MVSTKKVVGNCGEESGAIILLLRLLLFFLLLLRLKLYIEHDRSVIALDVWDHYCLCSPRFYLPLNMAHANTTGGNEIVAQDQE